MRPPRRSRGQGALPLIRRRRSIRRFKQQKISQAAIHKILDAGRWAPSGLNNQPWRLAVLTQKRLKEILAGFTVYGRIIRGSAAVILVFLDKTRFYDRDKDAMALGACIQNMLLETSSLGLGACWLGEILKKKRGIHAWLKTGKTLELMAALAIGRPAGHQPKGRRRHIKGILLTLNV